MNNQNINNGMNGMNGMSGMSGMPGMSGMINNEAFYNGGEQTGSPFIDEQKFLEALDVGARGGTSIQSLKGGGNGNTNQSFQYNPNLFDNPSQQNQQQNQQQQQTLHQPQLQPQFNQHQNQQQPQFNQHQNQQQQQISQQQQQFNQLQEQLNQQQQQQFSQKKAFSYPQQHQRPIHDNTRKFNDNASYESQNSKISQNSKKSRESVDSRKSNKSLKKDINFASSMYKLGNNINNKLKENGEISINSMSSNNDTMSSISDYIEDETIKKQVISNNCGDFYTEYLGDSILIIIIYVILSQDFLRRTISSYIPQIETEGIVGITIYGVIHAILYIVLKMIFSSIIVN